MQAVRSGYARVHCPEQLERSVQLGLEAGDGDGQAYAPGGERRFGGHQDIRATHAHAERAAGRLKRVDLWLASGHNQHPAEALLVAADTSLGHDAAVEADAQREPLKAAAARQGERDAVALVGCVDPRALRRQSAGTCSHCEVVDERGIADRDRVEQWPAEHSASARRRRLARPCARFPADQSI